MSVSTTSLYGVIGAVGTGIAALGTSLAAGSSMVGFPQWLAVSALICGALGGAISLTAKILGAIATPDKVVDK